MDVIRHYDPLAQFYKGGAPRNVEPALGRYSSFLGKAHSAAFNITKDALHPLRAESNEVRAWRGIVVSLQTNRSPMTDRPHPFLPFLARVAAKLGIRAEIASPDAPPSGARGALPDVHG